MGLLRKALVDMLGATDLGHATNVFETDRAVAVFDNRSRLLVIFIVLGIVGFLITDCYNKLRLSCKHTAATLYGIEHPLLQHFKIQRSAVKASLIANLKTIFLEVPKKSCVMSADFRILI